MSKEYTVETVDGFQRHEWTMTEELYIQHVLEMPREQVTFTYRGAHPRSPYWQGRNENGDSRPYMQGGLLTDEGVTAFAEQDYYDGPDSWKFTLEDFGY